MKDAAHSFYYYTLLFSLSISYIIFSILFPVLFYLTAFFRSIFLLHDEVNSFGLFVCARIANCEASDKKNYIKKYITDVTRRRHLTFHCILGQFNLHRPKMLRL